MSFFAAVILSTLRRFVANIGSARGADRDRARGEDGQRSATGTLTWLVLEAEGAPEDMRVLALTFLALVFGSVFLSLNPRAGDIEITYEG